MAFEPHDAATHALGRARALLASTALTKRTRIVRLRSGKRRVRPWLPLSVASDMRRLSVVMAVAALDTYMHSLVVTRAYTHSQLPGGLARLEVPFEALLAQADDAKEAARRPPHNSRPRVGVKRQLRDRLLLETFQSYEGVSRALGMAGLSGRWKEIGKQMSPQMQPNEIKARLDEIVRRRNQIVHEGDYERKERPRKARTTPMSSTQARTDIDFISSLVDAIHGVI
jgi:HEPN superfamily RiboL-PSP-like protein